MAYKNSLDVTPTAADVVVKDQFSDAINSGVPIQVYRVGVAGDVKLQLVSDAATSGVSTAAYPHDQTIKGVQAGELLALRVAKFYKIGTTAQNIIALW